MGCVVNGPGEMADADFGYVGWGGGVPLVVGDDVVGAVGVSGLPEDDDIALAELGAAALR